MNQTFNKSLTDYLKARYAVLVIESFEVRMIDISNTILGNLRDATPIESGRTLEF